MLRTILTFVAGALLGAIAGGLAVFFVVARSNSRQPARASVRSAAPPSAVGAAKTEEQRLAEKVGIELSPAETPMESVAAEPASKPMPRLEQPPSLSADAVVIPVTGVHRAELRDDFHESRGGREHHAIDIPAPRGTAVLAAIDGSVGKLFLSKPGGITIYEFDPSKQWIYYYAHLDGYAPGLVEGMPLKRGDIIGFVGTSGNAPPNAPHLHFSIEKLASPGVWWKSDPIDPYPILTTRGVTLEQAK